MIHRADCQLFVSPGDGLGRRRGKCTRQFVKIERPLYGCLFIHMYF